jgi:Short C-terminal domain
MYAQPAYAEPQYVQQAPAPAPPSAPAPDPLEQLTTLGQLRDSGLLTEAEFEAQKAKILAG